MKENNAGWTVIELMAFTVLFVIGFIPGHLVAQRAGIVIGAASGIVAVVVARIAFGLLMALIRTGRQTGDPKQPR
jgi:mannitol-specific phosphotransferase system IIBC component